MEKEIKYVAPQATVLVAQVEKGVYSSNPVNPGDKPNQGGW